MGLFSDKCFKCGAEVKKRAEYCSSCGEPAPGAWIKCGSCDKWIGVESNNCPYCGVEQHLNDRELIIDSKINKPSNELIRKIDFNSIRNVMGDFFIIPQGSALIITKDTIFEELLETGKYNTKDIAALSQPKNSAKIELFIINIDNFGINFTLENLKTAENFTINLSTELQLKFNLDSVDVVTANIQNNQNSFTFDDLNKKLNDKLYETIKSFIKKLKIDDLITSPELRINLENTLKKEYLNLCNTVGIELQTVTGAELYGGDYEKLVNKQYEAELKTREAIYNYRIKEAEANSLKNNLKTEADVLKYKKQLIHEYQLQEIEHKLDKFDIEKELITKENEFKRAEAEKDLELEIKETKSWSSLKETSTQAIEKTQENNKELFKTQIFTEDNILMNDKEPSTDKQIKSDCSEFSVCIDLSSTIFISGIASSLQLRLSPLSYKAKDCTDFVIYIKLPNEEKIKQQPINYETIDKPTPIGVNYLPSTDLMGINQVVEFFFSYKLKGETKTFFSPINIDIFSSNQNSGALIENINIKIDKIHQEGKAGTSTLNLIDDLANKNNDDINAILKEFKSQKTLWRILPLHTSKEPIKVPNEAIPNNNEGGNVNNIQITNQDSLGTLSKIIILFLIIITFLIVVIFITNQRTANTPPVAPPTKIIKETPITIPKPVTPPIKEEEAKVIPTQEAKPNRPVSPPIQLEKQQEKITKKNEKKLNKIEEELQEAKAEYEKMRKEKELSLRKTSIDSTNTIKKMENKILNTPSTTSLIDKDSDGIIDSKEIKAGLDPDDPKDAEQDFDEDGFTNKEEINAIVLGHLTGASTDVNNPHEHASFAFKLKYIPADKNSTLLRVTKINQDNIEIQTPAGNKVIKLNSKLTTKNGNFYLKAIKTIKKKMFIKALWKEMIVDVKVAELESEDTHTVYKLQENSVINNTLNKIINTITSKSHPCVIGNIITLGKEGTGIEKYKISNFNDKYLELIEINNNKKFTINGSRK